MKLFLRTANEVKLFKECHIFRKQHPHHNNQFTSLRGDLLSYQGSRVDKSSVGPQYHGGHRGIEPLYLFISQLRSYQSF